MQSQEKCKHEDNSGWIYQIYTVEEPCYIIRCFQCHKIIKKILKKDLTKSKEFSIL